MKKSKKFVFILITTFSNFWWAVMAKKGERTDASYAKWSAEKERSYAKWSEEK